MADRLDKMIGETFLAMADGLSTGNYAKKPRIALTGLGSELGEENVFQAAKAAAKEGIDVFYIGTMKDPGITTIEAADDEECHEKMEALLEEKKIDGAVTMHYPFPIGVSTVGRVITPAKGREMFVAATTGTASTDRVEGMILQAVYGIIAAKASGIQDPTVGILNVDGARQTFSALEKLKEGGYPITFASSGRSDGGSILRGNDVLQGSADVLVCDSLTGNILVKMLGAFMTGGNYEASGYGYGPGIGRDYDRLVMIVSRASGTPVITGAIRYAASLIRNQVFTVAKREWQLSEQAGLSEILQAKKTTQKSQVDDSVKPPEKEVVTAQIAGIDVMDLDDAVEVLWKHSIYAESGMGCTGPIILVSEKNLENATEELSASGYLNA